MVWTALILGFAGSLHCVGMCSPLAMAVSNMSQGAITNRIVYNVGRVLTYGLLGSIVASVGLVFPLIKYQNLVSILLGILLVIVGIGGMSAIRVPFVMGWMFKINLLLKSLFSVFLRQKSLSSTLLLGSLNGFVPCGLSFLAMSYCITLANPWDGFTFMLVFGLGTLPVMLGFTTIFQWTIKRFHFSAQRLTTGMFIVSGILLLVRVFFIHLPHVVSGQESMVDIVICR